VASGEAQYTEGFILENVEGLARMQGGETLELIVGGSENSARCMWKWTP
jgi:hypothetical protein